MEKKVMSDYTLYCTKEQTKKALELGAPIDSSCDNFDDDCTDNIELLSNGLYAVVPTAEQMIGFLEEQGYIVDIFPIEEDTDIQLYAFRIGIIWNKYESNAVNYRSRKKATLAAIDAALDYLTNNKAKYEKENSDRVG